MKQNAVSIIPTLRYADAPAAIEWLCQAFGFEKHLVVSGENGTIAHAQLTLGNAMIMLSSDRDNEYGKVVQTPKQLNGTNTQAPYIVIEAIDQHYQQAKAAGAEMIMDIEDQDYGGRLYTCRDPEGHVWNFGSYNPWQ